MHALFALLLALATSGSVRADDDAATAPFERRYEVLRNGKPLGEATLVLRRIDADTWSFTTRTRGTRGLAGLAGASIEEHSDFTWHDGRPQLLRYRYRQDVAFRTRERSLALGADGRIDSRDGDQRHDLPFEAGTMDRHVVVLAMRADLARGVRDDLRYRVANRDDVEWQRYRVGVAERIDAPGGALQALRVDRVRENPGRTTTSWLAPSLGWLPVRIVQREADGETIEMRLLAD
jgi:hypothetical protein